MQSEATLQQTQPGAPPAFEKIVVAIHGIGSQRKSDTIRSVARRFGDGEKKRLPVMPLGYFHVGDGAEVSVSRLDVAPDHPLSRIGFAEVYWADIPRLVAQQDDTLEETKAWGETIVSRAHATYAAKVSGGQLSDKDFQLGREVISEIIETIGVLENLLTVIEKLGVFKFDLGPLLRDYIGDVQLVAEFRYYREQIVARFHDVMNRIVVKLRNAAPDGRIPEIHIVAHSEGTVVSFLGLLQAMSGNSGWERVKDDGPPVNWVGHVRGFMTIGSPIDKHLILWPRMWDGIQPDCRLVDGKVVFERGGLVLERRIAWRNYYDFGDPIGFRLETAVARLAEWNCAAFDFRSSSDRDDFGFSRYWLPGKAHNDYWGDSEVFRHFIDDVVHRDAGEQRDPAPPPRNRLVVHYVSWSIPYLLSFTLHALAMFVLYKAVNAFLANGPAQVAGAKKLAIVVSVLTCLLSGVTVASRLPWLVKTRGPRWHLLAAVFLVVSAIPSYLWLPPEVSAFIAPPFAPLTESLGVPEGKAGAVGLFMAAALIPICSWLTRWSKGSRRIAIWCGAGVVLFIIARPLYDAQGNASRWPVVLAGAAFCYLWWLGMTLFDLAFVWHRYIRNSVAIQALARWSAGEDAKPAVTLEALQARLRRRARSFGGSETAAS